MTLRRELFFADPHCPYHDRTAWALVLKVAKVFKPHGITVLGDFCDFYTVSSHSKDPARKTLLREELAQCRDELAKLERLGADDLTYIAGNHEDRLTRYLRDKAPELDGLVTIPDALKLAEHGWRYVPYKRKTTVGKLNATHDVGSAGRYAVFRALDTFQHSVVTAHAHRLAYIVEGNAVGEQRLSAMFGWLGDADAVDYMHQFKVLKDWALGFGIGYRHPTTQVVYVVPVPIIRQGSVYSCVVEGRYYEVRKC